MTTIICKRRSFLTGLGASLLGTPFLPRLAAAGPESVSPRIVFIFTPNGTFKERWGGWPGGGGSVSEASLSDVELGSILQPFAPYRESMLALRGINMNSAYDGPVPKDHWPDYMNQLTGIQGLPVSDQRSKIGGISIDQVLADAFAQRHGATQIPSVQIGARVRLHNGYLPPQRVVSARGPDQPLRPMDDPDQVRSTFFEGFDLDDDELVALHAKRGRVFDAVTDELRSVECQLGAEDREKLEFHLESIQQLEDSMNLEPGSCGVPTFEAREPLSDANLPVLIDQQFDNLHAMLSCGMTRVATVMLGGHYVRHEHLGHADDHHTYSHKNATGWSQALQEIDVFYAQKIVSFLDRLASTPQGDGTTLFDHTLVVWCHEQSTGAHLRRDMPYVFAGGSHCGMEMGRMIHAGGDFEHPDSQTTTNDLWITVANQLGVPLESFGDPDHVSGPLPFL